jgi:hypothetical protein
MTQETRKKQRTEREYVVELEEPSRHRLAYTLGALGGLALGALLTQFLGRDAASRTRRDAGADAAPARFRPGRLRRPAREQDELLTLEDAVLDAFLADEVLCERGIDVGVVSAGIVELSGSVRTRAEAARAMSCARSVQGVSTVVSRMELEAERERMHPRFDAETEGFQMSGSEWTGHGSGMGRRRQGRDTDPHQRDDSRHQIEEALEAADRAQFVEEGYHDRPRVAERDLPVEANRTRYREDELDNQTPRGQHAVPVPEQPQALNSLSRVGEGLKPGTELELEAADVPGKPHQR